MPTTSLIQVENVSKTFGADRGDTVEALRSISLDIRQGEFLAIVGRSGCGKSTLLRILAGLIPATAGSVSVGERPVVGPRRDVAMVFQRPALLPWRTVLENVLLPVQLNRTVTDQDRDRARELITLVGLEGFEDRAPDELSGGMQQRAAICRSLIHEPSVMLLDEPFGALDALTREELGLEVQRMWSEREMTMVLVTHSITEAALLADRVVVLTPRPGRISRIIEIDVDRPRSLIEHDSSVQLAEYSEEIRRLLFDKHLGSSQDGAA